jgi:hypothetical protein
MTITVHLAVPLEDLLPEIHSEIKELKQHLEIILKAQKITNKKAAKVLGKATKAFKHHIHSNLPESYPKIAYHDGKHIITKWDYNMWYNPHNCNPNNPHPDWMDDLSNTKEVDGWIERH